MKKVLLITIGVVVTCVLIIFIVLSFKVDYFGKINNYVSTINLNGQNLSIDFKFPDKLSKKQIYCAVSKSEDLSEEVSWNLIEDGKCNLQIDKGPYYVFVKSDDRTIQIYDASNLKDITIFEFEKEKIYLAVNGSEKLQIKLEAFGNVNDTITYIAQDDSIADVSEDGLVTGLQNGITKIKAIYEDKEESIDIVVTTVITVMPKTFDYSKIKLPCNAYNSEEAELLDEILYSRIDDGGYGTRAGVVAAIRFLLLEFPYRINYFSENGRLAGGIKADGEGRYYHRGLYLSPAKYDIVNSNLNNSHGPQIWGCPLYSYISDAIRGNGLDCSGFVTWTLINGGFDVGDIGAGHSAGVLDLTDYGEMTNLTSELIYSGKIKAGDLIGYDGHIAIIIGIDDENIYVAESLWGENPKGLLGVVANQYKKSNITNYLDYVMLMDSYYKEDGNYTDMWY